MNETPNSLRLNVGIFGKTNSGKSSLLNFLVNQNYSIVSEKAGTTTDCVNKSMEISGIGPVLFIDTAGFCDKTELSSLRIEKTFEALKRSDVIVALFSADDKNDDFSWFFEFTKNSEISTGFINSKPFIPVISKADKITDEKLNELKSKIENLTKTECIFLSCNSNCKNRNFFPENLIKRIKICSENSRFFENQSFTKNLCSEGDEVLLVMPQDIQAPKGRLILPQVQIIRELLDKKCIVHACTTDKINQTLKCLKNPPKLIITDSQAFKTVFNQKPEKSLLTSFSILMAAEKGNIHEFIKGAQAIKNLTNNSKVLILEACTHVPLEEDIGRVKIPRLLRTKNPEIQIDFMRGTDFPKNLSDSEKKPFYDLIIQCGSCMFNGSYVLNRQNQAKSENIPMTNYGIAIAEILGILDKVSFPK